MVIYEGRYQFEVLLVWSHLQPLLDHVELYLILNPLRDNWWQHLELCHLKLNVFTSKALLRTSFILVVQAPKISEISINNLTFSENFRKCSETFENVRKRLKISFLSPPGRAKENLFLNEIERFRTFSNISKHSRKIWKI